MKKEEPVSLYGEIFHKHQMEEEIARSRFTRDDRLEISHRTMASLKAAIKRIEQDLAKCTKDRQP